MPTRLLLFIIFTLAWVSQSASASESFREIVATSIARDKTSVCALRDHYGFLWVGTMTGLACYDGNGQPVCHNASNTVRSTEAYNITTLFESDDDIWFGANPGLFIFNRASNTVAPFPYKTKYRVSVSSPVQKMMRVDDNHIWVITHGQGIFVFNTNDKSLSQNSRHGSFYSDMAVGHNGQVFTVTHDGFFQVFSPEGTFLSQHHLPDFVTDKNPIKMASGQGVIWISTRSGLYQYDLVLKQLTRNPLPTAMGVVNALLIPAGQQTLLLGTENGLWEFDTQSKICARVQFDNSSLHGALADSRMVDVSSDIDGSVILVSPSAISFMLHRPAAFTHRIIDPLVNTRNIVGAIAAGNDGVSAWIGTEQGLKRLDTTTRQISPISLPGGPYAINAIAAIGDRLWIGTVHQGLIVYHPSTADTKFYRYDENAPYTIASNEINGIYHTCNNEIFVLTSWGLCRYNPTTDNFPTVTEIGSHTPFVTMAEDRSGRLWTASADNTLYVREKPEERFQVVKSSTLGKRGVSTLFLDSNGRLWATSQGGRVFIYDEDLADFKAIDISIPREHPISFINEDPAGNIWVGTAEVVVKIDSHLQPSYHTYRPNADVLPVMNSTCRLPDGRILFGDDNAVWGFTPGKVKESDHTPATYIQALSFPYFEDSEGELDRLGLNVLLYMRDEIEIPYSNNTFTIHMAAKRLGDLPEVRYDYKLEGVDRDWIQAGSDEATYTALAPGKYNFLVKPNSGSDADISKMAIVILPPWYRSWWAWLIYALVALVAAYGTFLLSRRKIRQRTLMRVNEMRIEKEREAYETKVRFFVNLVHEIRTPLTLINLLLEQLAENIRSGKFSPEAESRHINSMQRNVNYLLGITNQLLDFRKAETDSEIRLVKRRINISALLDRICRRFEHPMSTTGKELLTNIPPDVMATVDPEKLDRVIMNLIGNAMKYARSRVTVSLTGNEDSFTITVDDDGSGIPKNETEKIFDTYYQIGGDNVAANLGTGLGLAYAKLIAGTHGGEIIASNNDEGGASFRLTIPSGGEETEVATTEMFDSPEVTGQSETPEGKLTILLVDDNPELLASVGEALAERHKVLRASNGAEGLKMLEKHDDIDLIISDFMMPVMDGGEFCSKVKENPDTSFIPFIMLTAKTGTEARGDALDAGAEIYIEKPFSLKQLYRQIDNFFTTRENYHRRLKGSEITITKTRPPFLSQTDSDFIEALNEKIALQVQDENFSIENIATDLNMSRSTFYRKIKALTGLSPNDYLKNFRLEHAASLLKSGVRIGDVAAMCGFDSPSYFAKCFKIKFGMVPKQFAAESES